MADVDQFTHGWVNPVMAYLMAFLGTVLGLVLVERSRTTARLARVRWLGLSGLAVGGTGAWLMHYLATLGFDIPSVIIRYDPLRTFASFVAAVVMVTLGLFVVGFGRPTVVRIILGGWLAGAGVAAMHYVGLSGVHFGGRWTFDRDLLLLSLLIAGIAGVVLVWFAVVIRGPGATAGAAALVALAMCSMHYTGMAAAIPRVDGVEGPVSGLSPFVLLGPIALLACLLISGLTYAMVGFSIRRENAREDAMFAQARDVHESAAILHLGGARHR